MAYYINLVLCTLLLTGCAIIKDAKQEQHYPVRKIVFYYSGRDPLITHPIPVQPVHEIPAASRNSINDSYWRAAHRTYGFYRDSRSFPPNILRKENLTRVVSSGVWHGYMYEELCSETATLYVYGEHARWGPVLYFEKFGQRTQFIKAIKGLIEANCTPDDIDMIQVAVFLPVVTYREHDKNRYLDSEELEGTPEGASLGRYVYYGALFSGDGFSRLWHDDPDGLNRYMKTFSYQERRYQKYEEAKRRRRENSEESERTKDYSIVEYCKHYTEVCVEIGKRIGKALLFRSLRGAR